MIGAEEVAEPVEANSEPGLGKVTVGRAFRRAVAEQVGGGASGPGDGDERPQEGELAPAGEAGVIEVEATWVAAVARPVERRPE